MFRKAVPTRDCCTVVQFRCSACLCSADIFAIPLSSALPPPFGVPPPANQTSLGASHTEGIGPANSWGWWNCVVIVAQLNLGASASATPTSLAIAIGTMLASLNAHTFRSLPFCHGCHAALTRLSCCLHPSALQRSVVLNAAPPATTPMPLRLTQCKIQLTETHSPWQHTGLWVAASC